MVRTVVSLDMEDKTWLDRRARKESVSMAELIRKAIRRFREQSEPEPQSLDQLLRETSGIWPGKDGLSYQLEVRDEWDGR